MNPGNGFCGNGVLQLENPYKSWLSRLYGPTMNIRPLSLQVWAIKVSEGYSEKSRAPLSKKTQRSAESKKRKREGANDEDILISGLPEGLNQCSRTASSPVSQTSGSAKKFKREENDDIDLFVCENGSSVHGKLKAKLKLESLNDPYFQCGKCLMKFRKSDNKIGACPRHTGKFVNRVFDTDKLDCCWGLYKNQPCMMSKHVMIQYEH
ncbi:hypothetical protein BGZ60DRAFT_395130 [Tricladium varicosporioides]|nr:hypothetical protein BGZ60DRAFT_395130 [Hymenoscyphus varicosporioides]